MITDEKKILFILKDVSFSYPFEEMVLKNLNIRVGQGERVCILGPNGCGKSTLLKMFAGLLFPKIGNFTAFDEDMTEKKLNNDKFAKTFHKRIGFIFQDPDVQLFCSTAEEEIAFGLLQQGVTQDIAKQRIDDIISMLGIEHLRDKTPFKLSGGEKKKIALASVLVMNPEVLIFDEPTNGLDSRMQKWLVELLAALNISGKTLISSTHNLELAAQISDRAILIDEAHTAVADLPTGELLQNYDLLKSVNLVG